MCDKEETRINMQLQIFFLWNYQKNSTAALSLDRNFIPEIPKYPVMPRALNYKHTRSSKCFILR